MTPWILFSEQQPKESDLPLQVSDGKKFTFLEYGVPSGHSHTHWRSLPKDLPVVVNEDEAEMTRRSKEYSTSSAERYSFERGWKAALEWERSRKQKPHDTDAMAFHTWFSLAKSYSREDAYMAGIERGKLFA